MYPGVEPRRLLVVDASHCVDRPLATASVKGDAVQVVFAEDREEAYEMLAGSRFDAVLVLPPLCTGDAFAFVRTARMRQPGLFTAIVLGDGRHDGAAPRIVWSELGPEVAAIVDAVTAIATLRITPEELGWWDQTATELMKAAV